MGILTELFYLPNIEYFTAIEGHRILLLDDMELYQKQSLRNRTTILLANKVGMLSVPVNEGNKKKPYKDIQIDYSQKWLNIHLRGIQSAYGKAPFFEYYFPYIEEVYSQKLQYLVDLNSELLTVCLKLLRMDMEVKFLSETNESTECSDIRGLIKSKEEFNTRNIYQSEPYRQLFGLDFVPNLSVIDLLFCEGPEAKSLIRASKKNE